MTPSRYPVIQCGGAWVIRSGNRTFGPSSDHVHATDAAIDFAEKMAKPAARESFGARGLKDVANRLDLRTRRDSYASTPRNPANGPQARCRADDAAIARPVRALSAALWDCPNRQAFDRGSRRRCSRTRYEPEIAGEFAAVLEVSEEHFVGKHVGRGRADAAQAT